MRNVKRMSLLPACAALLLVLSAAEGSFEPARFFLLPRPERLLILVAVYEGRFELRDGRWRATMPVYKTVLLD